MWNVLYYIPALIGFFLIAMGTYHGYRLRRLVRRCTQPAEGKLLGFVEEKRKGGNLYFPVVTFAVDGTTYKARYTFGNTEWPYVAGDSVSLRYNPANPEDIYLYHQERPWQQYASPVCIIVGGLLFIGAYYYML